jgi:hypothetical protein
VFLSALAGAVGAEEADELALFAMRLKVGIGAVPGGGKGSVIISWCARFAGAPRYDD